MNSAPTTMLAAAAFAVSLGAAHADGETIALYQDGRRVVNADSDQTLVTNRTDGLAIGQNSPDGDPFDGALDDVRIWSRARSAAQICAAAGRPGC